jgi:hypothetical protein
MAGDDYYSQELHGPYQLFDIGDFELEDGGKIRIGFAIFLLYAFCSLRKGFQFGQNSGEKFRNRRMNMHRPLDNRIRRLRIHDVQQNVNYFIASGPKNRSTQNVFCFRINRDFDKTLRLTFLNGPAHSAHRMFRNECSAPRLSYFVVRHAASA